MAREKGSLKFNTNHVISPFSTNFLPGFLDLCQCIYTQEFRHILNHNPKGLLIIFLFSGWAYHMTFLCLEVCTKACFRLPSCLEFCLELYLRDRTPCLCVFLLVSANDFFLSNVGPLLMNALFT
jgi:hypothetical protein